MKKILSIILLSITAVVLTGCGSKTTLRIYMPSEYHSEAVIKAFEKKYDVRVNIIEFMSNEEALATLSSASYDLIIPSDYALEELISIDYIQEIDWDKILFNQSHFATALLELFETLKTDDTPLDILKYGVPYFFGNVGLLYNKDVISKTVLEEKQWDILLDDTYQRMFYDSSRDAFMHAFMQTFHHNGTYGDINHPTTAQVNAAKAWLESGKGNKAHYKTDQVLDDMPLKLYDVAVTYSGDAIWLMSENSFLDYYVPTVGSNMWVDSMVIPKNAKQVDLAYQFISFMLETDNAYQNSLDTAYTSPVQAVIQKIVREGVYQASSYVIAFREHDQIYRFNKSLRDELETIWQTIRT